MTKIVELQRHTAADGTLLIAEDVRAALQIGRGSRGDYDIPSCAIGERR